MFHLIYCNFKGVNKMLSTIKERIKTLEDISEYLKEIQDKEFKNKNVEEFITLLAEVTSNKEELNLLKNLMNNKINELDFGDKFPTELEGLYFPAFESMKEDTYQFNVKNVDKYLTLFIKINKSNKIIELISKY
jgi:hypothetical protein